MMVAGITMHKFEGEDVKRGDDVRPHAFPCLLSSSAADALVLAARSLLVRRQHDGPPLQAEHGQVRRRLARELEKLGASPTLLSLSGPRAPLELSPDSPSSRRSRPLCASACASGARSRSERRAAAVSSSTARRTFLHPHAQTLSPSSFCTPSRNSRLSLVPIERELHIAKVVCEASKEARQALKGGRVRNKSGCARQASCVGDSLAGWLSRVEGAQEEGRLDIRRGLLKLGWLASLSQD